MHRPISFLARQPLQNAIGMEKVVAFWTFGPSHFISLLKAIQADAAFGFGVRFVPAARSRFPVAKVCFSFIALWRS